MREIIIAPSVLGCDQGQIAMEALKLQNAGADMIHLDVMDGVFVPVLTVGADVAACIARKIDIPVDAHLMVEKPAALIDSFAAAGCRYITVHAEVTSHLDRLLQKIRESGAGAGVAINPATAVDFLQWVAPEVDLVLIMTVNPGYGGQKHLEYVHSKIPAIRRILDDHGGEKALISIDGGVTDSNAGRLASLGVDILVSGSFITKADDPAEAIRMLRNVSMANSMEIE
ncbi:MAG: ribulose-phosphate 3-epimerase [Candidatus Aegiribacteria sp.]|nr:ribulose-phosphate 3-epimerase [Candidatus Aegiribacteria sp.]